MGKKSRAYSKPTPFKSLLIYFALFNVVALAYLTYSYNSNPSSTSTLNADQGFTPRITQEVNQTDNEYYAFNMDTVFYDEADESLSSDSEPDMDFLEEIASNLSYQGQVSYAFENPQLAYKALTLLDVFEPVNDSYFGTRTEGKNNYHVPWMGVINDDAYCEKNRAHFVEYPEFVFEDVNFITSSPPSSIMRNKAIPGVGTDIQPHIGSHMPKSQKEKFMHDLRPDAMVFFALGISPYKHIGKNFACLAQTSGHIPGHESFSRKDFAAESAINYAKLYEDKPQCFNHDKFFPKTWVLYNKENCEDFFEKFNSEEYKKLKAERNIVYIRKVGAGSHRGQGVFTVNDEEEALLRKMYKNGTLCGTVQKNYIVQNYVHNGLLLEGRKFDFRMYLLVASTNPLIAFYHDGFLRVSLAEYDSTSNDKKVTLTNLALNKQIYDEVKAGNLFNGMDEEDLKLAQQWSFERLHKYLMSAGIVTDENWLDNYLRPEFKKAMIHLMRMSSYRFLRRSSIYELYGVDFMLDTNLNLWFIEANSGPALGGYSVPMEKFIVKMIQDHFEVVVGLLRSRMKRVINYVNILTSQGMVVAGEENTVMVKDLKKRIAEFKIISQNKFELEFEPSAGNGFAKIIDENFQGVERYQGFIAEECLDSYEEL